MEINIENISNNEDKKIVKPKVVKKNKNSNNNITVDLYEKYSELQNKSIRDSVHFTCSICGEEASVKWLNIHKSRAFSLF